MDKPLVKIATSVEEIFNTISGLVKPNNKSAKLFPKIIHRLLQPTSDPLLPPKPKIPSETAFLHPNHLTLPCPQFR